MGFYKQCFNHDLYVRMFSYTLRIGSLQKLLGGPRVSNRVARIVAEMCHFCFVFRKGSDTWMRRNAPKPFKVVRQPDACLSQNIG